MPAIGWHLPRLPRVTVTVILPPLASPRASRAGSAAPVVEPSKVIGMTTAPADPNAIPRYVTGLLVGLVSYTLCGWFLLTGAQPTLKKCVLAYAITQIHGLGITGAFLGRGRRRGCEVACVCTPGSIRLRTPALHGRRLQLATTGSWRTGPSSAPPGLSTRCARWRCVRASTARSCG
jgi:hypothetical protein